MYDKTSKQNGQYNYIEDCGLVPQYTTIGTPEKNRVAKRRNYTLMDVC